MYLPLQYHICTTPFILINCDPTYSWYYVFSLNSRNTIRRYINIGIKNACFFILGDVDARHHRRNANRLDILPKGPHTFPIGKNSFFTCRAHVHNPGLVKDLKWFAPDGREIPQDDRYTNEILASACLTLLSYYANSHRIWKKIMIYHNYLRILHSSLPLKISNSALLHCNLHTYCIV